MSHVTPTPSAAASIVRRQFAHVRDDPGHICLLLEQRRTSSGWEVLAVDVSSVDGVWTQSLRWWPADDLVAVSVASAAGG